MLTLDIGNLSNITIIIKILKSSYKRKCFILNNFMIIYNYNNLINIYSFKNISISK